MTSLTGLVLRGARRLIERKGWAQAFPAGDHDPEGFCAAWAIVQSARKLKLNAEDVDAAMLAFAWHNNLPFPSPGYNPTQRTTIWNDTLGRTEAEVIDAFRIAEMRETAR